VYVTVGFDPSRGVSVPSARRWAGVIQVIRIESKRAELEDWPSSIRNVVNGSNTSAAFTFNTVMTVVSVVEPVGSLTVNGISKTLAWKKAGVHSNTPVFVWSVDKPATASSSR
jgi:hypothetical protein